jgi:hypothetical protein
MKQKNYAPVTPFERQTSHCPLYVAWVVLDEARDYFRTNWVPSPGSATLSHLMSEGLADKLAQRAERVFANQPFWQRKFQSAAGREHLLSGMRHWLAGVLAKEQPALFRDLPDSYKVGAPLPEKARSSGRESAPSSQSRFTSAATVSRAGSRGRSSNHPTSHFVHGCELLAI